MSELRPGTGYESLPEISQRFIDFVNDHARVGDWSDKEVGPSYASFVYDIDLSDSTQIMPFDGVLFEDSRQSGFHPGQSGQKDMITFLIGRSRVMAYYHQLGLGREDEDSDGFSLFLFGNKTRGDESPRPEESMVATMLQQLDELEQAGKMTIAPDRLLP